MPRDRIQVLSPRTWGEFGNYLAATRLSRVVSGELDADVTLLEAEPILPWLGEVGAEIREITVTSADATERTRRYLALMGRLAARFPRGFEVDEAASRRHELAGLVAHFDRTRPDVVIGTKGFVARLCVAAARAAGYPRAVVSHVTNPGLLHLDIHRSPHPDLTMVSMQWAKDLLIAREGGSSDRIHVVGPLVAEHDLREFLAGDGASGAGPAGPAGGASGWGDSARPKIIVFSNRGGPAYPRVVRHLADRHPDIDLVFVGYNDPHLAEEAAAAGGSTADWRFHSRLTQAEYFDYIDQASRSPYALLISKGGPNTTLEAAYFGIPVLMLESGLPMENWVADLIHDNSLGRCCATADELIAVLDDWLAHPEKISAYKRSAVSFAGDTLDQRAVAARIGAAVGQLTSARQPSPWR